MTYHVSLFTLAQILEVGAGVEGKAAVPVIDGATLGRLPDDLVGERRAAVVGVDVRHLVLDRDRVPIFEGDADRAKIGSARRIVDAGHGHGLAERRACAMAVGRREGEGDIARLTLGQVLEVDRGIR